MKLARHPQLRTIFLFTNVLVLLLPIGGIGLLRMYESELIRQTEAALIGQAALLSSIYANELAWQAKHQQTNIDYVRTLPADSPFHSSSGFTPVNPRLDIAIAEILPSGPPAQQVSTSPNTINMAAGAKLQPLLKDSQKITLCGIRLFDSKGVVVASSGSETGLSLTNREEVRRSLQGYYSSVLRKRVSDEPAPSFSSLSRKGWVRVLVAMPVLHDQKIVGGVLLSRSPLGVSKGLYFIRKHLLLAGFAILALVIFITWLTNALIGRPLKKLVVETKKVEQHGGVMHPLDHPGSREVADLSQSISEMANGLQTRADYIKSFANHVSHEFKTPLTSLKGAIELLQDMGQEMSTEERLQFLENMDGDVRHLDRLTRGLLELARADMAIRGDTSCEPQTALLEIEREYNTSKKTVTINIKRQGGLIMMDGATLKDILTNLITNSFRHGQAQQVSLVLDRITHDERTWMLLSVVDDGTGIVQANRDKIFTPFFTTARNQGGTGLGLAIGKALLAAHGGRLVLADNKEGQCVFEITLPFQQ
ncbi:sensor histidine kinase KdpD [Desulfopila sp. IMCC35008]|uniref:sensor histidine kinase n=1 Tax=Desulfopila sp. IMCC35008 TaxID=2653858 RepID=UPI0013D426AC|nr:HAMP domain-containing sensor histidine kinase [Desulfopila sp. IMCC35008]